LQLALLYTNILMYFCLYFACLVCWCPFTTGAQDLAGLTAGAGKVLLVGITCGLSAPYVAGQIDYAMTKVQKSIV